MTAARTPRRAYVLGGGIAGITAALRLRARGSEVTLCEAHRWLGGRVFSVFDARLGGLRDNGPHVMLGCYDAFRALLRELGTEHLFARAPALAVAYADARGRAAALRLPRLPVPLAMPWALLRLSSLSIGERLRALLGLCGVVLGASRDATLEDWLRRYRQHGGPRAFFWDPLCLAIMNAEPACVSARLFVATMRRAFCGSAGRGAVWLPDAPWSEIIGTPALRTLRARGVTVALGARVRALVVAQDRVRALDLGDTATMPLGADDVVVSALPWHRLAACLPPAHALPVASQSGGRPIASVYFALESDPPLPESPLVILVGGAPFHFLVRRPSEPKRRFALLAGGTTAVAALTAEQLAHAACAQLRRHFPGLQVAPEQVRAVKEAQATLLADPQTHAQRPPLGPHPSLRNLYLVGDWCATGLPSTMEGAAQSARWL
jgi:squalene-associated FAD-dependent desaturase